MDETTESVVEDGEQSEEEVRSRYKGLPIGYKNYIKAICDCGPKDVGDGTLLVQKPLSNRDVDPQKGRFSSPTTSLTQKDVRFDVPGVLIEPSLQKNFKVDFKKKKNKNYSGKDGTFCVMTGSWNEVVTRNNLQAGQIVQLWSVLVGIKLLFVLRRLNTEEGNNAVGGSDAAAKPSSSSSDS